MNIKNYLDSTYLKTAIQAAISEEENKKIVFSTIQEAIEEQFKLVMIRPEYVQLAKQKIRKSHSKLLVGTVISFPEGTHSLDQKLEEAKQSIQDGVDDLDFVINYMAFINGEIDLVTKEIVACTQLGLNNHKIVKWIIEIAALTDLQLIQITTLIKNTVIANFNENDYSNVFVKSSTGFYQTKNNFPNGATIPAIKLLIENASPLPVKAAGGVRNYNEAIQMIQLGVKRIGTSAAKTICRGSISNFEY